MATEKQKMLAGELYHAGDPELQADMAAARRWMARYNDMAAHAGLDARGRHMLLVEGLGSVGEGTAVRPPFHCDYGFNIHLGSGVFLNFNCVILDVVEVRIGDGTQIGPGVQIYAADHPGTQPPAPPGSSRAVRCASAETSGSAEERSCCPA